MDSLSVNDSISKLAHDEGSLTMSFVKVTSSMYASSRQKLIVLTLKGRWPRSVPCIALCPVAENARLAFV